MTTDRQPRRVLWGALVGSLSLLMAMLMGASAWFVWDAVEGIRNPAADSLPERADAVVVFAGEDGRFTLGRELVEAGRAPVLVLNAADLPEVAEGWCDGISSGVEVVCLFPEEDSTRSEATAFGALAGERQWTSLIGVTGDYHVQRAGSWLRRCFSGEVSMAQLDWGAPSLELTTSELLGYGQSIFVGKRCWSGLGTDQRDDAGRGEHPPSECCGGEPSSPG